MDFQLQSSANTSASGILSGNGSAIASDITSAMGATSIPTANSVMMYDANGNIVSDNYLANTATIVSAGTTTLLVVGSAQTQIVTGTLNQTIALPNATTLQIGHLFTFANLSTGIVTITDFGGNILLSILPNVNGNGIRKMLLCLNPTITGVWQTNDQSVRGRIPLNTDVQIGTIKARISLTGGVGLQLSSATSGSLTVHAIGVQYTGAVPTLQSTNPVNLVIPVGTPTNVTGLATYTNNNNTGAQEIYDVTSGLQYKISYIIAPTYNSIDVSLRS